MNAKIYKDGNRVIVSFEGFQQQDEAEEFLKRVVEIVSGPVPLSPEMVSDLDPIVDEDGFDGESLEQIAMLDASQHTEETIEELFPSNENECGVKEPENEDFPEPFAGRSVDEIISAPKFEGFYFLCERVRFGELPQRYKADVANALLTFIKTKTVLDPPYGDVARMKSYCKMGQRMLGKTVVPDKMFFSDDPDFLDLSCQKVCEFIQAFCEDRLKKYLD